MKWLKTEVSAKFGEYEKDVINSLTYFFINWKQIIRRGCGGSIWIIKKKEVWENAIRSSKSNSLSDDLTGELHT